METIQTDTLTQALHQHFGFGELKPGQRAVMEHLLAGRSAAAVFPTGGGKSLCYQLPALVLPGVTLVVSPLIALMKDQIDMLAGRGIAARRLDSSLDADAHRDVMEQVRSGALRLLYVAPERFNNERFRQAIAYVRISLFAVDEAHCISEWGHNFRPDYLKLAGFARDCGAGRVLALTATATQRVLADICRELDISADCAIRTGFYRPNLTLLTTPVEASERDALLLARLRERPRGPTIVYVTLQRTAEGLAQALTDAGLSARPYHAGLKDEERTEVQDAFMRSEDAVVVATIAFGMGIDKANIRYVYHYNLPKSLENYSQEVGRAGRDGEPSRCELFACPEDLNVVENFVYGDTPSAGAVQDMLDALAAMDDHFDVGLVQLSAAHDIRPLVVRTLLTYLELDGYLEGGTPFYSSYEFRERMSRPEILAHFDPARGEFLTGLFESAKKRKTWFALDLERAAQRTGSGRDRIVRALDYLGEQQMLEVRSAGVRHRYRWRNRAEDPRALARSLHQRALEREAAEIARLGEVLEWVANDGCQVSALNARFAEPLDQPCGHCSWCLQGGVAPVLPARHNPGIDEGIWQQAQSLRLELSDVLAEPRSLARLLCGVRSPKLSRSKLGTHRLFGALAQVPFQTVLARAEELDALRAPPPERP